MVSGYNIIDQHYKKRGPMGVTGWAAFAQTIPCNRRGNNGVTGPVEYPTIIVGFGTGWFELVCECVSTMCNPNTT